MTSCPRHLSVSRSAGIAALRLGPWVGPQSAAVPGGMRCHLPPDRRTRSSAAPGAVPDVERLAAVLKAVDRTLVRLADDPFSPALARPLT